MPTPTLRRASGTALVAALFLFPACDTLGNIAGVAATAAQMRNLVQNGDAESGDLSGWTVQGEWTAAADLGHDSKHAFGTSYVVSTRYQEIDLLAAQFTEKQLDSGPQVHMSEWVGARHDSGGHYFVCFELLDANRNVIQSHTVGSVDNLVQIPAGTGFFEVAHVFDKAPPGLRYLRISDGGRDDRRWAGYYGPHFDDAAARVLPTVSVDG